MRFSAVHTESVQLCAHATHCASQKVGVVLVMRMRTSGLTTMSWLCKQYSKVAMNFPSDRKTEEFSLDEDGFKSILHSDSHHCTLPSYGEASQEGPVGAKEEKRIKMKSAHARTQLVGGASLWTHPQECFMRDGFT